jgi:hypothetical protein
MPQARKDAISLQRAHEKESKRARGASFILFSGFHSFKIGTRCSVVCRMQTVTVIRIFISPCVFNHPQPQAEMRQDCSLFQVQLSTCRQHIVANSKELQLQTPRMFRNLSKWKPNHRPRNSVRIQPAISAPSHPSSQALYSLTLKSCTKRSHR